MKFRTEMTNITEHGTFLVSWRVGSNCSQCFYLHIFK